jgi:hypothetical protein
MSTERASSYYQSLIEQNERLTAAGKPPVAVRSAPESLEDEDLLEMVNAGLIPITVVDDYLAELWKNAFTSMTVHDAVAVRTGANLAVAIRKNSPQAAAGLNGIIKEYGLRTAFGNTMEKRYVVSPGRGGAGAARRREARARVRGRRAGGVASAADRDGIASTRRVRGRASARG